jgi:hypothetical protein
MKKMFFAVFFLVIIISSGACADVGANTVNAAAGAPALLYPSFDYFTDMHVKITGDDKAYSIDDPVIERLLTSTAKAKEYLDSYYFKNGLGHIILYSAAALMIADYYYVLNGHWDSSTPVIAMSVSLVSLVAVFAAPWIMDEGFNDFYKSVNEYNLTITCGKDAGAAVKKNIKF